MCELSYKPGVLMLRDWCIVLLAGCAAATGGVRGAAGWMRGEAGWELEAQVRLQSVCVDCRLGMYAGA